jgi:hypothetical protein
MDMSRSRRGRCAVVAIPAEVPTSYQIKHLALANCLFGALADKGYFPNPLTPQMRFTAKAKPARAAQRENANA